MVEALALPGNLLVGGEAQPLQIVANSLIELGSHSGVVDILETQNEAPPVLVGEVAGKFCGKYVA